MIARCSDHEQTRAVEAPLETSIAILGAPGTGKSTALARRVERISREAGRGAVFAASHPDSLISLARIALETAGITFTLIDDVEAESRFAGAAQPLLDLAWVEFEEGNVDPEVPGLRSPDRFLLSAFRLFRKLRDAAIDPAQFLARSLSAAAAFYAKPPNFAHPELIRATKEIYRDSLVVTPEELARQYRREIDLAKILARLYDGYIEIVDRAGAFTAGDAVARAVSVLRTNTAIAGELRKRFPFACIDDAQDIKPAATALLESIYGSALNGVTLAGDPGSATNTFRGSRPERAFAAMATRVVLQRQHRSPLAIELACGYMCGERKRSSSPGVTHAVTIYRAKSQAQEAAYIADRVRTALDEGSPPDDIALIFRSVCDIGIYEHALLQRGVAVAVAGDRNIFNDPRVLDALAPLWNLWDPFGHDWMLRTLGGHAFALSDASLAVLCSEPANIQTALFPFDAQRAPTARAGRWDPKRDLRLGWNVIRGEQDAELSAIARERVRRFRAMRESWLAVMNELPFDVLARRVWSEALATEAAADSARARSQHLLLEQLLDRLQLYSNQHPGATLGDILDFAQHRAESDLEGCEDVIGTGFVRILSVDAARGRSYPVVVIPDARAGSFPRWYVTDSFLFSPKLGMVAKDNVGDAKASRTAKFSYYIENAKTHGNYNAEERRAFVYAMRRATHELIVTASGRATQARNTPEFLEELRTARLAGTSVVECG
ncbi:MAG: UvrD-helicase domain-containing protein [Candidatus Eremiobacteraeota bacterium]|nr:UvrD-helicase domain-containing protein [Candidatus Eremiobacteraeota bacterium]